MKHRTSLLLTAALLAIACLAGCAGLQDDAIVIPDDDSPPAQNAPPAPSGDDRYIGAGDTELLLEITDDSGVTITWHVNTDETTVGAALLAVGLIDGDESEFGLMVKSVNGLVADYDKDGAYWAFFIDGEYAMAGVDLTEIEQGRVYALVYTSA